MPISELFTVVDFGGPRLVSLYKRAVSNGEMMTVIMLRTMTDRGLIAALALHEAKGHEEGSDKPEHEPRRPDLDRPGAQGVLGKKTGGTEELERVTQHAD